MPRHDYRLSAFVKVERDPGEIIQLAGKGRFVWACLDAYCSGPLGEERSRSFGF